jgi:predicted transcriptional regulator
MENSQPLIPSISLILKKISDDKTLTLFNSIAVADGNKYIPLKEMNLTTKQYYARISGLLDAGLVKRYKGKYSLTMLGKVVYQSQTIIGKTLAYYWKLKAIESLETSASGSYSSK